MKHVLVILAAAELFLFAARGTAYGELNLGGDIVVPAGKTVDSAVSIGGNVRVFGTVSDDAVSIGGKVIIENGGLVRGDAVSVGRGITVGDSAMVRGDAVSIGGAFTSAPTGTVRGETVRTDGDAAERMKSKARHGMKSVLKGIVFGPLFGLPGGFAVTILTVFLVLKTLFFLVCAMIIQILFTDQTDRMADGIRLRFGTSLVTGLLVIFLIPIAFLLMIVSIIGIPFIPFAMIFMLIMSLFGMAGTALWAGKLLPKASTRSGLVNVVLGILALGLVRLVPIIGLIVWILTTAIAFGAVTITRFGTRTAVTGA